MLQKAIGSLIVEYTRSHFRYHDWSNISDVRHISKMDTAMIDKEMKIFIRSYLDYFVFWLFQLKELIKVVKFIELDFYLHI
jgi:pantothenate kinase-related protein Tda10